MKTPQQVLQEYADGITQVLDTGTASYSDKIEMIRQREMFVSSIRLINNLIEIEKSARNQKQTMASFAGEVKKTKIINCAV